MTLSTTRPEASSSTLEISLDAAAGTIAADTTVPGGSYVTLPAGTVRTDSEGSYVTAAGAPDQSHVTRGSYITVDGTPVVPAGTIEGSYVTLPTSA